LFQRSALNTQEDAPASCTQRTLKGGMSAAFCVLGWYAVQYFSLLHPTALLRLTNYELAVAIF